MSGALLEAAELEACRRRYLPFVVKTHRDFHVSRAHRLLAQRLEGFEADVRAGLSPRLMLFLAPRFGKSTLVSRHYPPWLLGRNPDWNVGIVSYGAELAEELSADARRVVLGDEYRAVFGGTYAPDAGSSVELDRASTAVNHWRVANHDGGVRAVGVGGALTGRGFQAILLDDPLKGRKEADSEGVREDLWRWYQGTLRTRLEPGGGIVLVQTRWHHDDLAGRLLEAQAGKWDVISLPAIAEEDDPLGRAVGEPLDPERFDAAAYAAIREDVGERDWYAQYQGKPTPDEGDVFHKDWFRREWPAPDRDGLVYQYWDTAHGKSDAQKRQRKGDFSVCRTIRVERDCYRTIHLLRARLSYPELKAKAVELRERFNARAVIVEDTSAGQALIQDLRNETRLPVLPWKVGNESKVERAKAAAPTVQAGRWVLSTPPAEAEADIREHLAFPNGKFDDMVDTTSMAIAHLEIWTRRRQKSAIVREFRMVA